MSAKSPTRPQRPSTLADIAAQAGVNVSTASRVLRGDDRLKVRPETRDRIRDLAKALDYHPNAIARSLRTARSMTLGIVVPQLENPVFAQIIVAAEDVARRRGYSLLISHLDEAGAAASLYERLVFVNRVDGLLIATLQVEDLQLASLRRLDIPFMLVNRQAQGIENFVASDDFAAARLATAYLIAQGHRRIAHLAGPTGRYNAEQRAGGYRRALEDAGLPFDPALVVAAGYSQGGGETAMRALIASGIDFTAVFAVTLVTAAGAMATLHEAGRRIPEDVSVMGFHDGAVAEMLHPKLTTVRLPTDRMGREAAEGLIALIEGETQSFAQLLPPGEIVVRASVAAPPQAGRRP